MRSTYRHIRLRHLSASTISANRCNLETEITSHVRCGPPLRRWVWLCAHLNESIGNSIDIQPNWSDREGPDGAPVPPGPRGCPQAGQDMGNPAASCATDRPRFDVRWTLDFLVTAAELAADGG